MNDTTIIVALVIILICHLAVISIGYKIKKTVLSISYVNAIFVIALLVFWGVDIVNIKEHHFEFRELILLGLEVCILICAIYSITGFYNKTFVKVINYIGFWFHVLALVGMLIFMWTFTLNGFY
ncbi:MULTISPECIES: hypothetical protein [unclassified Algibacter]|uniref:hypothetical protein n=1 Tax=unclassified Algibacter TaxID=2615009 RepID=UPI00131C92A3|nr:MULTISPECIES: hypothetical protein [unclassified Algibacter]MCL5129993.1 hypothetical protein [Algibacter sp. L4_22]